MTSLLRRPGAFASFSEWHPVELYRDSRQQPGVRRPASTKPLPYSDKVTDNCDTRAQWRADQTARVACSGAPDYLECMQTVISRERAAAGCLHQLMYPAPAGPLRI